MDSDYHSEEEKLPAAKNAVDLQRLKLEKLMKNIDKPVFIPNKSKDKKFPDAPEFVRNVMGSSAGAGSGEFHVYRHIRRREYNRQMFLNQINEKDVLNVEYHEKLEQNKVEMEEKTAKKRSKRQKRKQKMKQRKLDIAFTKKINIESSTESDSENEQVETASGMCPTEIMADS